MGATLPNRAQQIQQAKLDRGTASPASAAKNSSERSEEKDSGEAVFTFVSKKNKAKTKNWDFGDYR